MTLANKYRPTTFSDVVGQDVICKILQKEIDTNNYTHSILFTGGAGTGKTTCGKIFANLIDGEVIFLDCAAHNGVTDIKEIINKARIRSLIHTYKVFLLDECHSLSPNAWNSLLMTLEEDLPYSIFVFCTTDVQKIPNTIMSRVQRFNFVPIPDQIIRDRLKYVCEQENIEIDDKSLQYIIKSAKGSLRQALTNLDKCILYGLSENDVCKALNIVSDDIMSELYNGFINHNKDTIIRLIEDIYNNGYELHIFIRYFLDYCLKQDNINIVDCLLTIIQDIKYDDTPKNLIIARLLTWNT